MIPYKQTKFGNEGNCWQTCIASIIRADKLDDVPDFVNIYPNVWFGGTEQWLAAHNIAIEFWPYPEDNMEITDNTIGIIGCGMSDRGYYHAVVVDEHLELIHDPHPADTGIDVVLQAYTLERI